MRKDPHDGFYENSLPLFGGIIVTDMAMYPAGSITAKVLHGLAVKLKKLEYWHRQATPPSIRLIQVSSEGRVTALVESGTMTLKLALRRNASSTGEDEWVVLGDALKVSD